jgi:hypothetical protein
MKAQGNTLVACDPSAEKFLKSLKLGEGMWIEVKRQRNVRFHRRFFALLNMAFDLWEPAGSKTFNGRPVEKHFERFREEVLVLAGHYDVSYGLDGSVRFTARSISFGKCDEHEFNDVYRSVLGVVWNQIFAGAGFKSEAEVEQVVSQLLAFE